VVAASRDHHDASLAEALKHPGERRPFEISWINGVEYVSAENQRRRFRRDRRVNDLSECLTQSPSALFKAGNRQARREPIEVVVGGHEETDGHRGVAYRSLVNASDANRMSAAIV
jgi:hypothetical protein